LRGCLTVDHMLNGFFVVFADIDDARFGFSKPAVAGSIEEYRAGTYYSTMDCVSLRTAYYCEIRIFSVL
jgi:hypothetical protein